jgi:hypothetical protein
MCVADAKQFAPGEKKQRYARYLRVVGTSRRDGRAVS